MKASDVASIKDNKKCGAYLKDRSDFDSLLGIMNVSRNGLLQSSRESISNLITP